MWKLRQLGPVKIRGLGSRLIIVLLAEDDQLVAAAMQAMLENANFRVAAVSDALGAMKALASERPDVAIVDLNLTDELTGPQIARAFIHASVPVVVCSGDSRAREHLAGLPVAAVLDKPVDPSALLMALLKVLPPRSSIGSAA